MVIDNLRSRIITKLEKDENLTPEHHPNVIVQPDVPIEPCVQKSSFSA